MIRLLTLIAELISALVAKFSEKRSEKEKDLELSAAIDEGSKTGDTSKLEGYISEDD
jgi:hypothetical protein